MIKENMEEYGGRHSMATLTVSKEDEKRVKALGFLSNKGTDDFSGREGTADRLL